MHSAKSNQRDCIPVPGAAKAREKLRMTGRLGTDSPRPVYVVVRAVGGTSEKTGLGPKDNEQRTHGEDAHG